MNEDNANNEANLTMTDMSEPRIGVYVCHCGGNISDVVDVKRVAETIAKLPNVVVSRDYIFMCSDPGQNLIIEDIKKEKLNRVIVAACSPSLHDLTFRGALMRAGLNPYLYENVNIREQVSWVSKSDKEGATRKAIKLIAAALGKSRLQKPLEAPKVKVSKHIVVVGGGVSGLRSARELARYGFEVSILEQMPFVGGRMAQIGTVYPTGEKAKDLLDSLIDEVTADKNIKIYTGTEITDVSGYVGNFKLKVKIAPRGVTKEFDAETEKAIIDACPETTDNEFEYNIVKRKAIYRTYGRAFPNKLAIDWKTCTKCGKCVEAAGGEGIVLNDRDEELEISAGAIILATGFDHYTPARGEYGYEEFPEVITLPQLIRMLDDEGPTGGEIRLSNERKVKNVCLIHCVGSRQIEGVNKPGPNGRINEYCSRVCCTATLQMALELRKKYPEINIFELYQDIRTYGRGHEDYYMDASNEGVTFFRYDGHTPPVVEKAAGGDSPLVVRVKDSLTFGEELSIPADLVVLSTGMVPHDIGNLVEILKLPRSSDGFLQEVHPKLRPVELAATGIMIAGTSQAPMDITESSAAAAAAAVKSSALLSAGEISLDPFVAQVDLEKCEGTGKCVEECPYEGAVELVEMEINGQKVKRAKVNAALCAGCGICVAVCPTRAIQVAGWRLDQYDAMIDAFTSDEPLDG